jgi:hypothetical protein
MNAARGPTREKYLARTIQDFTTKVLNGSFVGHKLVVADWPSPVQKFSEGFIHAAVFDELAKHRF